MPGLWKWPDRRIFYEIAARRVWKSQRLRRAIDSRTMRLVNVAR